MDTEEERREFYSLAIPIDEPKPGRKGKGRKKKASNKIFDISNLRHLYNNDTGLVSIGKRSTSKMSMMSSPKQNHMSKKSLRTSHTSPLGDIMNKKISMRNHKSLFNLEPRSDSILSKNISERVNKINEFEEEDEEDSPRYASKTNVEKVKEEDDDSLLDPDQDDFLAKAEKRIEADLTQVGLVVYF
jgi:hypothetical protein